MKQKKQSPPDRSPTRWSVIAVWLAAAATIEVGATLAVKRFSAPAPALAPEDLSRPLTFHKDIAPIIFNHCSICHHPGEAAPFDLLTYADVKKRARQIADLTARRLMPPWLPEPGYGEFVGQRSLKEEQIRLIQRWAAQGANEGNASDAPPPPQWRDGWQLGPPDLVIQLPQPYALAADGKDVYRNFVIPIPVSERRYAKAVELLPGNAKAVHHAFMLIDPARDSRRRDQQDAEPGFPGLHTPPTAQRPAGHFLSWQPGKLPTADDDDLAWTLEKDTDLILQMHLRPTGKPELIQPSVGFHFTNRRPSKTPFKFGLWTHEIDIPADATNHICAGNVRDARGSGGSAGAAARALPGQTIALPGHAAGRRATMAGAHPGLGLQLAGRLRLHASGVPAQRHDHLDDVRLRQLDQQRAQPPITRRSA